MNFISIYKRKIINYIMGVLKKEIIYWKKKMFGRMVMVDSVPYLSSDVFVKEIDKLIEKIGKKENEKIKIS